MLRYIWNIFTHNIWNTLTLLGTVLSVLGIGFNIWQVKALRRQRFLTLMLDALDKVCTTPAPYIATYQEIYRLLFSSYSKGKGGSIDELLSKEGMKITDNKYLADCLMKTRWKNVVPEEQNKAEIEGLDRLRFPVVTKNNFLLSYISYIKKPDMLKIETKLPGTTGDLRGVEIRPSSKDFLNCFRINDFASFLLSKGRTLWNASTFELEKMDDKRASFKITEQSLTSLKTEGVPDDVLEKLQCIKDREAKDEEQFLAILKTTIGDERTVKFNSLIMKHSPGNIELTFRLGSYNNYINNNELLLKELYFHSYVRDRKKRPEFSGLRIKSLFWVQRLLRIHTLLPKEFLIRNSVQLSHLFKFEKRQSAIGFSIFVIMAMNEGKDKKYCTFIQKRDSNQAEHPGFYHVAPAGTFQPLSEFDHETIQRQCTLQYTVLRELLEEVFNLDDADKNKGVDPFEIFRLPIPVNASGPLCSDDTLADDDRQERDERQRGEGSSFYPGKTLGILEDIQNGKDIQMKNECYEIIPTSFSIDLMTLKPHISFVLVIKTPALYKEARSAFRGNWEGSVKEFDIDSDEFSKFLENYLNINWFPPVGAITMAEGLHYYSTKIRPTPEAV